jgi:hypothetical protein
MSLRDRIRASLDDVGTHGRRLVQLNVDVLKAELQDKAQKYGAAVGLGVGAVVVSVYALGFALATITVVLALVLPLWLALLIVTAALIGLVAVLALVARGMLRAARTPAPRAAATEAQATLAAVRVGLGRVADRAKAGAAGTERSPTTSRSGASVLPSDGVEVPPIEATPSGHTLEAS